MGNMISHFRREKKIKQCDLAAQLDVSPSYLCKIEKGIQEPTEKFIQSCVAFFNVSVPELFPGKKKKIKKITLESNGVNKLWLARIDRGIKQYELARLLNCSPSYLSKVEKGLQMPTAKFRKKCAKILRIKEVELFPA